jgi:hypothetical protein
MIDEKNGQHQFGPIPIKSIKELNIAFDLRLGA